MECHPVPWTEVIHQGTPIGSLLSCFKPRWAERQRLPIPGQRARPHDDVVDGGLDNATPPDTTTLQDFEGLTPMGFGQQAHPRIDTKDMKCVMRHDSVRNRLGQLVPTRTCPTTEALVEFVAKRGDINSLEKRITDQ